MPPNLSKFTLIISYIELTHLDVLTIPLASKTMKLNLKLKCIKTSATARKTREILFLSQILLLIITKFND